MAENTKIEWATHTFNPWEGCQKVGPGCDHCYAETRNARFGGGVAPNWGPGAPRRHTSPSNWYQPIKWNAEAMRTGTRPRVFCASLADVFDNAVDDAWRAELGLLIADTPSLDWLLLTKRIGNARTMLMNMFPGGTPEHVRLGATIVNQEEADRDIPKLLAVPAAKRFLSMEPLLGPVDLGQLQENLPVNAWLTWLDALDWIIVGGESGPGARPMHPDWARSLRDQCADAGVPFLFKQWGDWLPGEIYKATNEVDGITYGGLSQFPDSPVSGETYPGKRTHWWDDTHTFNPGPISVCIGKKAAGRLLDGGTHDGVPA